VSSVITDAQPQQDGTSLGLQAVCTDGPGDAELTLAAVRLELRP